YKNPGGDSNLFGGRRWHDENPQMVAKAAKYVDEKAIPQILELIDKYHPDIFWFDTPHKLPYSENLRILKSIWDKDRNVVVNGRITDSWPYGEWGDYKSTDDQPVEFFSHAGDWEAIPTTNDSYGYSKADKSHKPVSFFIRLMSKASARGGNLLMNLGPMGDGAIDDKDKEILSGIGKWMDVNGESIYGTKKAVLPLQSWGVSTTRENRIYLHVFNWPKDGKLNVGGLKSTVKKAYLLADDEKESLKIKRISDLDFVIKVPKNAPDTAATVIVLEIDGEISADKTMFVATNSPTQILAYDAKLNGDGLRKESGQKDSYYVNQMTKLTQNLTWTFRTNKKSKFKVFADYVADRNT
ncbi:MAG: alpha-L-fucosidase, partial [Chryseobacterium sp.]